MRRGTTPILNFKLPFVRDQVEVAYVTGVHRGETWIDKSIDDDGVEFIGNRITVHLTQEETLRLSLADNVRFQVRVRFKGGTVAASKVKYVAPKEILKGGII